jgi:hypothetical protein
MRQVGGAHLQRVDREPGGREQRGEALRPLVGQRRIVLGRAVLIQDYLDGGFLLVLHGHVLAVGDLVRITEAEPVIGPQRRLVPVGQQPHVRRAGRVRFQR